MLAKASVGFVQIAISLTTKSTSEMALFHQFASLFHDGGNEHEKMQSLGLDSHQVGAYLFGMFKTNVQTESEYWLRVRAGGKSRFIWQGVVRKWSLPV